jgi:hypothetical protein
MLGESKQHVHTGTLQLQADRRRETPSVQLSRIQLREGRDRQNKSAKNTIGHNETGVLFQLHYARSVLRGGFEKLCGAALASSSTLGSCGRSSHIGKTEYHGFYRQQGPALSVLDPNVNSVPLDNMFRVISVVQIMVLYQRTKQWLLQKLS